MKLRLLAIKALMERHHVYRSGRVLLSLVFVCVAVAALLITVGEVKPEIALTTSIYGGLAVVFAFVCMDLALKVIPEQSQAALKKAYKDEGLASFVRRYAALELEQRAINVGADAWAAIWRDRASKL